MDQYVPPTYEATEMSRADKALLARSEQQAARRGRGRGRGGAAGAHSDRHGKDAGRGRGKSGQNAHAHPLHRGSGQRGRPHGATGSPATERRDGGSTKTHNRQRANSSAASVDSASSHGRQRRQGRGGKGGQQSSPKHTATPGESGKASTKRGTAKKEGHSPAGRKQHARQKAAGGAPAPAASAAKPRQQAAAAAYSSVHLSQSRVVLDSSDEEDAAPVRGRPVQSAGIQRGGGASPSRAVAAPLEATPSAQPAAAKPPAARTAPAPDKAAAPYRNVNIQSSNVVMSDSSEDDL